MNVNRNNNQSWIFPVWWVRSKHTERKSDFKAVVIKVTCKITWKWSTCVAQSPSRCLASNGGKTLIQLSAFRALHGYVLSIWLSRILVYWSWWSVFVVCYSDMPARSIGLTHVSCNGRTSSCILVLDYQLLYLAHNSCKLKGWGIYLFCLFLFSWHFPGLVCLEFSK